MYPQGTCFSVKGTRRFHNSDRFIPLWSLATDRVTVDPDAERLLETNLTRVDDEFPSFLASSFSSSSSSIDFSFSYDTNASSNSTFYTDTFDDSSAALNMTLNDSNDSNATGQYHVRLCLTTRGCSARACV